jgi:hypothetical protein
MDWQSILNIVAGAVLTAIGWWCREIWDSLKSLKSDIQRIEIDLPKTYVSKAEINTRFDKIDSILERIFDKLDHKADK